MIRCLVPIVLGLVSISQATPKQITGRLVVGPEVWVVSGSVSGSRTGIDLLALSLSNSSGSRRLVVRRSGSEYWSEIDGAESVLDSAIVRGWASDLYSAPGTALGILDCSEQPPMVCESRGVTSVGPGLHGRVRLTYNRGMLARLTFFGLEEWGNPFDAYISLDLEIR
mgnify:CR=1 FL=1